MKPGYACTRPPQAPAPCAFCNRPPEHIHLTIAHCRHGKTAQLNASRRRILAMYSRGNTLSSILFVFLMPNIDFVEVKWNVGNTDGLAMRLLWALTRPAETSLEGEENTLDNLHFSTGRERAVNVNAASSSASCSVKCFLNFLHLDDKMLGFAGGSPHATCCQPPQLLVKTACQAAWGARDGAAQRTRFRPVSVHSAAFPDIGAGWRTLPRRDLDAQPVGS
jgi:hypothetical protein